MRHKRIGKIMLLDDKTEKYLKEIKCYLIIILLFLSFSQVLFANNLSKLTLSESDAIQIAFRNNKEIAILHYEIKKTKAEICTASQILNKNPELDGQITRKGSDNQHSINYELSINLPIEIRGQRHYRKKIAEANCLKSQIQLQKKKMEIVAKIKKIFITLKALKEKQGAFHDILRVENDLFSSLKIRANHGEISRVMLNTVSLEVSGTKEELLNLEQSVVIEKRDLERVMNYSISQGTNFVYGQQKFVNVPEIKELINYAKKNNPDIKIASLNIKIADNKLKLTKIASVLPQIAPSIIFAQEGKDTTIGGGLSFPLPIFNLKRGKIIAAEAMKEKTVLELELIREKVISELNKQYELLDIIKQKKKLYTEEIFPTAKKNLNEIKKRYQRGEINLVTLERYWDEWVKSRINYSNLMENYYGILSQMELLKGADLKDINLSNKNSGGKK